MVGHDSRGAKSTPFHRLTPTPIKPQSHTHAHTPIYIHAQRADEYCHTEQEAAETNPAYAPPSDAWPDKGDVRVAHLTLRYPSAATCVLAPPVHSRLCLSVMLLHATHQHTHTHTHIYIYRPVIRDLSFAIPPGTRVGVVGRTGAYGSVAPKRHATHFCLTDTSTRPSNHQQQPKAPASPPCSRRSTGWLNRRRRSRPAPSPSTGSTSCGWGCGICARGWPSSPRTRRCSGAPCGPTW